jgi:hypothetical protein
MHTGSDHTAVLADDNSGYNELPQFAKITGFENIQPWQTGSCQELYRMLTLSNHQHNRQTSSGWRPVVHKPLGINISCIGPEVKLYLKIT